MNNNECIDCASYAEKISKVACWWFDIKSKNIYWSDEVFSILGFDGKSINHKRNMFRKLLIPEDLPLYKEKIKEIIKTGKPNECMLRIKRKDAKIAYCFLRAIIVKDPDGKKIVGTIQDLTQFMEAQTSLEKEKLNAERMNVAKSYFLAQASHDLHQPLQAIKIFTYNLLNEKLSPKQRNIVDKIKASSDNLETLLGNFLDISKLESGGFENNAETFNIADLLEKFYLEYKEIADDKHIKLKFIRCKTKVRTDPVLLERILRNLVSNAFKYTKDKVLLGCKHDKNTVKIMIIDNGVGISEKEIPYLFDEFYQSDSIKGNKRTGAGLGLHIVKKIALILKAKISVKSEKGKGSCFSLELPRK